MRRCVYKKIHYLTFDLDHGVKVTQNDTQYPLHHVIYASIKFEVATSNGLGEDTKLIFLFLNQNILWVLKNNRLGDMVILNTPKHMFKLIAKKIITFLHLKLLK